MRHLAPARHTWKFFRRSGLDQVALESGADLLALGELDQKLWVALSCPVQGLELDEKTLALIDTDGDGRIRVPEVIAAVQWAAARLKDPGVLLEEPGELAFSAINSDSAEGREVLAAFRQVLARLGKPETASISVEEMADRGKIFPADQLRGDGIVTPESAPDPETAGLIRDILSTTEGAADRKGVKAEDVEAFTADLKSFAAWLDEGKSGEIAILGPETGEAFNAVSRVRENVEDYFTRCRLAEFDPGLLGAINRPEGDYVELARHVLGRDSAELAGFPIARVEPGKPLPFRDGVNPVWAEALAGLQRSAVAPIFGPAKSQLTAEEWSALLARFGPHQAWLGRKPKSRVETLGTARIRAILAGDLLARLGGLIEKDRSLAPAYNATSDLERLVRYRRDLRTLLRNFVNFADFYSLDRPAVFQAGTLYVDSRSCDLCLRADNPSGHAALAEKGRLYIAYCDCRRPGGEKFTIAACLTQGDNDFLYVGRNGLFYDRKGREWDATLVRLIENPISIRQAFFTPYKRVAGFVQEQLSKFAASKDQAVAAGLNQDISKSVSAAEAGKAANQSFDIAKFAGIFAAIGLAIGAIGGAIASVAVGFMHLAPWQMPLAIAGALLLISGPSMLIAAIKLHQRNLGPVLEASGWAINSRVKINFALGRVLTELATLPPGAKRHLHDPYKGKAARRWWTTLAVILLLAGGLIAAKVFGFWPFG